MGTQLPKKGTAPTNFWCLSIVAERSPISATTEHLFLFGVALSDLNGVIFAGQPAGLTEGLPVGSGRVTNISTGCICAVVVCWLLSCLCSNDAVHLTLKSLAAQDLNVTLSVWLRAGNGSMGHGSCVKWVTKIGWVTWVMGH